MNILRPTGQDVQSPGSTSKGAGFVRMVELILAKRCGAAHSRDEIDFVINGIMDGSIPEYQLAAWLMAVCWQGMNLDETAWLTKAMAVSGDTLDLSSIGPVIGDKHSTGGVGDKTTLVFAPLMAAAGIPMAKLSGRGLGHTGGTIDKLEAIPGFQTDLPIERFIDQVKNVGAAICGQTKELAPADGKIYALRDVTGTVESIPLIAASVMSKKVAAGANLIILDVKCGAGAFMETEGKARELASTMVEVGRRLKTPVSAVVTDMEQPLGLAVGHTLEVMEAIDALRGEGPPDLMELCLSLGALALVECGKYKDELPAREFLVSLISTGRALSKFREIISAQGGNPNVIENPRLMPTAEMTIELTVPGVGDSWIQGLDGRKVAESVKIMGAGRTQKGDPINLAVGVVLKGKIGTKLSGGQTVATVYADKSCAYQRAIEKLKEAITYSDTPVTVPPVVRARV